MNHKEQNDLLFRKAALSELVTALVLLKQAAESLLEKGINQWSIWLNPDKNKINWVREGFEKDEFYFVETRNNEIAGMFRLMEQDELYWGKQEVAARYVHSFIVTPGFKGVNTGRKIMAIIEQQIKANGINLLRLDCIATNQRLCAYYESLGFVKQGEKQMQHSLNTLYEKTLH